MLKHAFDGTPFTIGIEEELMILDSEGLDLAQGIEAILAAVPDGADGYVKPELMQSVLEVATKPCPDVPCAGEQLAGMRRMVSEIAARQGLRIGAAGTHPFALWERQEIVDRPRYRELAGELAYIARRELIFGTHIHVAINGPNKAIYVADGIRRYLPLLLGLSANSPFWRGADTGLMSARTPIFRGFPRVGIPPHYGTWEIYSGRVELMMRSGAIEDYTYLWWDVRPHPNLGTVETRVFDQQTELDDTIALAALTASLAHRMSSLFDAEEPLVEAPAELVDDNKVRAAISGIEGELVDFPRQRLVPAGEMARNLLAELREHAQELSCEAELEGIAAILERGTGARRQLELWRGGGAGDIRGVVEEIAAKTVP